MPIITGSCHCDNISYTLDWPESIDRIAVRACSCGFCQKHGAVYTSHPDSTLSVSIDRREDVTKYRFGHETADFYLCSNCGCLMFAVCRLDDNDYAVVNVNNFNNISPEAMHESITNFDAESIEVRLARRKQNWTPRVLFN